MIKTFVFGTPHGFDFYEKDPLYNKYFQGFYISNRKGRRLMVNRKDNGETIYSYIHYGFKEIIDRPAKGLFGMSLILDNDTYCSDFSKIFDWFEYLFGIIEKERNIFKLNESGIYQYTIDKFSDNASDVEWLKSVMPNIFSNPSAGTSLVKYDSSFSLKKTGKIFQFNNNEEQSKILNGFRQCRWLCISPDVVAEPELDYFELLECYNEFNEKIVQIAINATQNDKTSLSDIQKDCEEHFKSINDYLKVIVNYDQKHLESFTELAEKFQSLHSNVGTLLNKLVTEVVVEPTRKKICSKCGRNLPVDRFSDESSDICRDCERSLRVKPVLKTCKKCSERKPLNNFHEGKDICIKCEEQPIRKPTELEKLFGSLLSKESIKTISIIALLVVVSVVLTVSFKKCSSEEQTPTDRTLTEKVVKIPSCEDENKVNEDDLNTLLDSGEIADALAYIKNCTNGNDYKKTIQNTIQKLIFNILQSQPLDKIEDSVKEFIILNKSSMKELGYKDDDIEDIKQYAADYVFVQKIIKKEALIESEYNQALAIADNYNLKEESDFLKKRWKSQQEVTVKSEIVIQIFDTDKKTAIGTPLKLKDKLQGYKVAKVGQYVKIVCEKVQPPKSCPFVNEPKAKEYWIRLTNAGKAVYTCDEKQVTIEAKEATSAPTVSTGEHPTTPKPQRH